MAEPLGSGKRKIDDEIKLAKQKAEAIAARILSDADSKRPRTSGFESAPPLSSFSSSNPSFPVSYATQTSQYNGVPSSKKMNIPNAKVGVIIGRGGDMIKNLQQRSGAKIQITRDSDADPTALTRDVELMGTQEQISRAEELITEVIAETDAASSASSGNRGVAPLQPGSEQFVVKVPNDKVALVIGKGGETIKSMQTKTGARIQVVPLHLPPGDTSTERNVFINGTKEQIEAAKELVNEVISGNRSKGMSGTNAYIQAAYAPGTGWAPQGQAPAQQPPPAYGGYTQPGGYVVAPPPYYGGYPPQATGWEQQANPPAVSTQQQTSSYDAYGQQAPPTSTQANVNYNYSQMASATGGYNYNQGYPQHPGSYGQDMSGQADQAKSYANPNPNPVSAGYGASTTSSQLDGTQSGTPQTSQAGGYGAPAAQSGGGYDGTTQGQSTYALGGYGQTAPAPAPAPASGYGGAYPNYSAPPAVQAATYNQSGYPPQMGYGQQQEGAQVPNQAASYPYYGYPPAAGGAQSGYYQGGGYPPTSQPTNGYGAADGGDSTTAVTADKIEKHQS